MSLRKKLVLAWRWSTVSAAVVSLLWTIRWLATVAGPMDKVLAVAGVVLGVITGLIVMLIIRPDTGSNSAALGVVAGLSAGIVIIPLLGAWVGLGSGLITALGMAGFTGDFLLTSKFWRTVRLWLTAGGQGESSA